MLSASSATVNSNRRVRLFDMVRALTTASELLSSAIAHHGTRVAYIAYSIGQEAGLAKSELHELILAGELHDIGALALKERLDLLQFEATNPGSHAELGYLFLSQSRLLDSVSQVIRYHHEDWNQGAVAMCGGAAVPLNSHIIHLADRIDTAVFRHTNPLGETDEIVGKVSAHRGSKFVPSLVDAFEALANKEYFWLDIVSDNPEEILNRIMEQEPPELDNDAVLDLAKLFCHVVDFKSTYTSTHSAGVANVAAALAELIGFSEVECQLMLIAGYLHDLGKLAVPSEILDKPAGLSKTEYGIVRGHTYYTRRILGSVPGLETMAEWASSHHERLDGQGYPYHWPREELSLGSRIMAVADVFTALTEVRPYRGSMGQQEALQVIDSMVLESRLDATVVSQLKDNYEQINSRRVSAQQEEAESYLVLMNSLRACMVEAGQQVSAKQPSV